MRPSVSFEVFPPKSLQGSFRLWDTVRALAPLAPEYVSVTYGAGGTTRALTHDAVTTITAETGLPVAAHLTCVGASRAETLAVADRYARAGISDIVALRGDMPGGGAFEAHPEGFASSVELIEALAARGDFTLRVGAYPETHPEAGSQKADIAFLKAKLDAGASEAITQFFFEPETFLRFRDACAAAGITAPIRPGILPIADWAGTQRFAARCGATVPGWLAEAFAKATRDGREDLLAISVATEMCSELVGEGVEHLHFYTLNRPDMTRDVCRALGLQTETPLRDVA